ncbi:transposase [Daejeonella sp.]|uniref:transposase n=1 Tax=Daejeonella sp. TaxID=2805397 RepID=UPI0030C5F452
MAEEGYNYHLYNRGNNKQKIFFEEANYVFFLKRFADYLLPHVDVFAYCLMPNHFHFFIRVNNPYEFEKGIKNFFISYSKAINKKYNRVGHLFQGRYKLQEVTDDSHFTRIITYIHQNPYVANLVKRMEDYKYSSYRSYLLTKPSMLERQEVLDWFGGLEGFFEDHKVIVKKWFQE